MVLGEDVSEDCLTLNVYRASNVSASKGLLPVAVYIHSGLFKHGSGRDPRYNMTSLLQVAVQNDYVDASTLSDVFSSDITTLNRPNPVVDGDFLQDLGSKELNAGHFVKVPLLLGTTQDEEIIAHLYPDNPALGIPSTLDGRPGNDTGLGYQWKRSSAYNGDKNKTTSRSSSTNVTLSESLSPTDQADQKKTFEPLSYLMSSMWISFFDTMSPNNIPINGTKTWPKYTLQQPEALVFDVNATQLCRVERDDYRSAAIAYWMDLFTDEYPK
ncbi:alpha/beta-hydrolase [Aspergillus ibericus CBS 121593]|uniref:Alpha/beta-hydrolase n=1 Tax=Aspergillus ibericus CBS 121593 TaxID=1448316 RepID=A0A395GJM6_9EURO|nr:alpha/beta-hydrolase [Aspergillus ibericus CBS 121593]RAK95695.1 alpha/beta-hydrolase [Aspergillus ibericus CBS 121593]